MKRLLTLTIFALISGVVLAFIYAINSLDDETPSRKADFDMTAETLAAEKLWWQKKLRNGEPALVYEDFKKTYASLDFPIQHGLMHTLGEAIYDTLGIEGIYVCDKAYSSACYHSFFGRAINEHGINIISTLDQACINKYGAAKASGCQHGIGHGTLSELGRNNLVEALQVCDSLTPTSKIIGCKGGIFMEYNQGTISDGVLRVIDYDKPYYPCDTLASDDQPACYFELQLALLNDNGYDYKAVAKLCADIEDRANRNICLWGLGVTQGGMASFDPVRTINGCLGLDDFSDAPRLCLEGASWAVPGTDDAQNTKAQICGPLEGESFDMCVSSSRINNL